MAKSKTGQATRIQYKPGQPRPERELAPEGDAQFTLKDMGKAGPQGWKIAKPGKFPYRMVTYEPIGMEDSQGKSFSIRDVISSAPGAFFRVYDTAAAAGYPKELDIEAYQKPADGGVREFCGWVDDMLEWMKENDVVMSGEISHEEYNGSMQARIKWVASEGLAEEVEETEDEEQEEETEEEDSDEEESDDEDSDGDEEDAEYDEEQDETETEDEEDMKPTKTKSKAKPAAKPAAKVASKTKSTGKPQLRSVSGKKK